jgi:hypothetical protein
MKHNVKKSNWKPRYKEKTAPQGIKCCDGWDLAECLERLTANAEVATVLDASILRHSGILRAADEAVLKKVL